MASRIVILDPRILLFLVEKGAVSIDEAEASGISIEILEALRLSGLASRQGKIYALDMEALSRLIKQYEEIGRTIEETRKIPTLNISTKKLVKLGEMGIKNIHVIYFHPHQGPILLCSMRYTELSRVLMSDHETLTTLSMVSRRAEEIKVEDSRLLIRVFTTRYHGRELFHIIAAEVTTDFDVDGVRRVLEKIRRYVEGKSITPEIFKEAIEKL